MIGQTPLVVRQRALADPAYFSGENVRGVHEGAGNTGHDGTVLLRVGLNGGPGGVLGEGFPLALLVLEAVVDVDVDQARVAVHNLRPDAGDVEAVLAEDLGRALETRQHGRHSPRQDFVDAEFVEH